MAFVPFYLLLKDIHNYPPSQRKGKRTLSLVTRENVKKKNQRIELSFFLYGYLEKWKKYKEDFGSFLLPITQFGKKILVGPSGKVSYILTSFFSFLFSIMKKKKEEEIFEIFVLFFYQWCTKNGRRRKNRDSNLKS